MNSSEEFRTPNSAHHNNVFSSQTERKKTERCGKGVEWRRRLEVVKGKRQGLRVDIKIDDRYTL